MKTFWVFLLLAISSSGCQGWMSPRPHYSFCSQNNARLFADTTGTGVQTIDLEKMDDDHEKEGQLMAESIVRWLDIEWMPQQVHIDMAESAKRSYVQCREKNQSDVMDIMMQISTDLDENWAKYNDDAFINAWDIGNYCSDYLIKRSGSEGCGCASEIM